MKLHLSLLFALFLGLSLAFGQISGRIVDGSEEYPLEYATAALYNQENGELVTGVITNLEGIFTIPDVKRGVYYLEASFIGFQTSTIRNIQIQNRNIKSDLGIISLGIGDNQLSEVVVQSERKTVINKIDRQVYDAKAFQNTQGGSATDVIKNLPSVTVNGLGEISVRGTTGFVVLLNGKPLQGNAANLLSQFPANAIERVELITAPSAKYDPEGKGGILNVITKNGAADGVYAQINVKGGLPSIEKYDNSNSNQRHGVDATYNLRKGDWNISLGGNYQRNDIGGRREGDVFTIINDTLTQFPSDGERSFD